MKTKPPKLILASSSAARKAMLKNAGLEFEIHPADINEAEITAKLLGAGKSAEEITTELAIQKALAVSKNHPDDLVIGSDQTLVFEGKIFSKAVSDTNARDKLKTLRSKTHSLNSSACIAHKNQIIWKTVDTAQLSMKNFSDEFLNIYCEKAGSTLISCVGAYQIEGYGAWLFDEIKGDYFTIMGMPLLPLLSALEQQGISL